MRLSALIWFGLTFRFRRNMTLGKGNRARWRFLARAVLAGLPWLLSACYSPPLPTAVSTPTCYPRPEATGEKVIMVTIEAPPPAQVSPGQTITITFSGSYIIANNAIVCGENNIVNYAHSDTLPGFSWDRSVDIMLDEKTIVSLNCGYACRAEVAIPADIKPGPHQLTLRPGWERVHFDLVVTSPQP